MINWDSVNHNLQGAACTLGLVCAVGEDWTSPTFWCAAVLILWKQHLDIKEGVGRGLVMMDAMTEEQRHHIHQLLKGQDPGSDQGRDE